jgi:hypothetical protein
MVASTGAAPANGLSDDIRRGPVAICGTLGPHRANGAQCVDVAAPARAGTAAKARP